MDRQISLAALVVAVLFGIAGCAAYHRKPILDRQVLRDLQTIRLEALSETAGVSDQNAPEVDAAEGLSPDEAVAVALYLNPDLRSFRRDRGVAEGELITAGLLPNPEITGSTLANLQKLTGGLGSSGLEALLSPFRLGERSARVAQAQARIEEIKNQISSEEWRLVAEVRKSYLTIWALEEQLKIDDASVSQQERILNFFREKQQLGDASGLDLNLVSIERVQVLRQREVTAAERDREWQVLLRLMGLPPLYRFNLKPDSDPIAYRPLKLDPSALESLMLERRPQLAAAKQEYEQAEESLRLAYIQRVPWFSLGPSLERETEGSGREATATRLGLGFGLLLPVLNWNQGVIPSLEANREKLLEGFTAKVHTARAEVNEALRNLRAQERLILLYQDTIQPALDENVELTEAGFELGDLNLLQLITTQSKVLQARREFVNTELEYWKAATDLELAIGAPLAAAEAASQGP